MKTPFNSFQEFEKSSQLFLDHLWKLLNLHQVKISEHWDIDHICYRVDNLSRYHEIKKNVLQFSELLIESEVQGRPIATFKLNTPLTFKNWCIQLLEIPAPKATKFTPEGFEHIEIVCDIPFSRLQDKYKNLNLDLGGLKKDFNQEFEIVFGAHNIKFHHLSLESVIRIEKNKNIFNALKDSQILQHFHDHAPLIAGTFPLGLNIKNSDLDVLMQSHDLNRTLEKIKSIYGKELSFSWKIIQVDAIDTLLVHFQWQDIPFELFIQNIHPVEQKAYLHFLCEEKILKIFGQDFKSKVLDLRAKGLKTEPSFAQALNLTGDPYLQLLNLQKLGTLQLANLKNDS